MLEVADYNVAKIKQDLLYESESSMIIIRNRFYLRLPNYGIPSIGSPEIT